MPMNKWNDVGTGGIGVAFLIIAIALMAVAVGAIYITFMPG